MEYLLFLQELRGGAGAGINELLYYLSEIMGGAIAMMIPLLIYWCLDKKAGLYMTMSFTTAYLLNQTIKNTCCVYRPAVRDARIQPVEKALKGATGYSFPSGHTVNAGSVYGGLALWQKKRKWVTVLCTALMGLTGFSRNWLGVHTLWDVLAAIGLSLAVLCGCRFLFEWIEKKPNRDWKVWLTASVVTVLLLIYTACKNYPMDYTADGRLMVDPFVMQTDCFRSAGMALGFWLGWLVERRWIRFQTEGGALRRCLRFIIGALLTLALYAGVLPAILAPLGEHWGKFFKYFVTFVFAVAGYPALFRAVGRRIGQKK